ncbi:MAG: serine protease [Nanoarchaeota archaeon]|nr:serine protease [Nanoarchaeota archaeon]
MKHTLEALVAALALSATGCVTNTSMLSAHAPSVVAADGKLDSVDDYVNPEDPSKLKDANYMVISESKYKNPKGETVTFHSLGSAGIYKDIGSKTYLFTANHVVQNEKVMYDFFGRKYELLSEKFYLLEDDEVDRLHGLLKKLAVTNREGKFYVDHLEDPLGNRRETLNYIIRTSDEMGSFLKVIKPKTIKAVAQNENKDLAVISVPKLDHKPLPYTIGNAEELRVQNLVYVVGWPLGLLENVTQGHITAVNDSRLVREDPETAFISDAQISPGNSGGGIYAVRDGRLELVGITSAMYLGGNSLFIGVKINGISEVFKGNSIRCASGWKCNLSSPYELKL